jgi:bis(5'-nucleosidyl)-tetraphosphatase
MPVERSAGIVIYKNTPHGRRYLVLRSSRSESEISAGSFAKEFWDLPKGVLERGETGIAAARREAAEEAGITDIQISSDFKETVQYFTRRDGKAIPKFVAMFLGEVGDCDIILSWEHDRYEWLLYEDAYRRVTLKPMKDVIAKVEEFLYHASR